MSRYSLSIVSIKTALCPINKKIADVAVRLHCAKLKRSLIAVVCALACTTAMTAQTTQMLTGTVLDSNTDEPLIGASVLLKGTTNGTITDLDGHFTLSVADKVGTVEVSYIGYQTKTVSFKDLSPLVVRLDDESQEIEEVVVIGYGIQKKSDLTGSVSSVAMEDVKTIATTNVAQALQGKAAGVEVVSNSGAPGAETSIRIRGIGTVNNSEPLYVVDGTPMESISYLASEDIESIEILKDAASAAIYGARAANGVVLISTKDGSGSKKRTNLSVSFSAGFQDIIKQPNILSPEEYAVYYDYIVDAFNYTQLNEDGSLGIADFQKPLVEKGNNWWDMVTRKGAMYKAGVALSGGDKDLNYYLSGNYQRSDGIVRESDYQRLNVTAKINARLAKNLRIGANMSYSGSNQSNVPQGKNSVIKAAQVYNPLTTVLNDNDAYTYRTPVELIRRLAYKKEAHHFNGQLNLDWDIVRGLTFTSRAGYVDKRSDVDRIQIGNSSLYVVGSNQYTVIVNPISSSAFSWDNTLTFNILDERGKDALTTVRDHNLNLMVGQTMEMYSKRYLYTTGYGYGGYNQEFNSMDFASFEQSASSYKTGWNALGVIARLNYNYKGRYYLQSNFRADASSRFAKRNRWGFFPSVSVGWKLTGEEWMQDQSVVSLLKLRAGWGQLGNNQIDDLGRFTLISYDNENYIYGIGTSALQSGLAITQYGNEDIRWERTESWTVGLDFNLSRNRFTSAFDFFVRDTKDMLIEVPIVYSAGFPNTPYQNAGSVRNMGFEILLGWKDQIRDWHYELSGNFSRVKNMVTSLGLQGEPILGGELSAPNNLGYITRTTVGLPIACFYGYKTAGLMQEDDFNEAGKPIVPVMESTTAYAPGDMKFVDINGDGKIDDNDRTVIGSPHPDFYYGFNLSVGWRGLDLSLFFQGTAGNDVFNVMKYFNYSYVSFNGSNNGSWGGEPSNVNRDYLDRVYRSEGGSDYRSMWGANTHGDVPKPSSVSSRSKDNYRASDWYIEDGSYLRLKNLQLSYSLPEKIVKNKMKLETFKFYFSTTNVFTISKYGGLDPEVGKMEETEGNNLSIGVDEGIYPQSRTYMFGLVLGL